MCKLFSSCYYLQKPIPCYLGDLFFSIWKLSFFCWKGMHHDSSFKMNGGVCTWQQGSQRGYLCDRLLSLCHPLTWQWPPGEKGCFSIHCRGVSSPINQKLRNGQERLLSVAWWLHTARQPSHKVTEIISSKMHSVVQRNRTGDSEPQTCIWDPALPLLYYANSDNPFLWPLPSPTMKQDDLLRWTQGS